MATAQLPKYFVNYVKETLGVKNLEVAALEDEGLTHAQKYDALFEAAKEEIANPAPAPEPVAYAQPAQEQAAYEEPAAEEPVYAEPAVEEPVYEQPVAEEPATQQAAAASLASYQDDSMSDGQTARDFHEEHMHTVRLQQQGITEEELAQRVAALMAAMGSELPTASAAIEPAAATQAAATATAAPAGDPMSVGQTARDFHEEHMHDARLQQQGITEEELAQRVAALMAAMGSELPAKAEPAAAASAPAATAAAAPADDPMSVGQTARDFHESHMHDARLQQQGITEDELAAKVASLIAAFNKAA